MSPGSLFESVRRFLGVEFVGPAFPEKIISGASALIGMLLCFHLSSYFIDPSKCPALIASIGASAVLVFGVPHGPLSQPWSLVCGHFLSAMIGVTFQKIWGHGWVTASGAVAVSIFIMHLARCVHPPGGATALTAVIGGPTVESLGYSFLLTPVLMNVFALLFGALILNYFLPWRRYPAEFSKLKKTSPALQPIQSGIEKEDLEHAIERFGSLIDVSEKDLEEIYQLAEEHARGRRASIIPFKTIKRQPNPEDSPKVASTS